MGEKSDAGDGLTLKRFKCNILIPAFSPRTRDGSNLERVCRTIFAPPAVSEADEKNR